MRCYRRLLLCVAFVSGSMCGGCAVPNYDVPYSTTGQPTVHTIVARVQCELRDMVRNDHPDDPITWHRDFLLNHDYEIEAALSVEVNNTGGLAPVMSYMNPLTAATSFAFGGTGTLSESRDHTFTENLQFSIRDIYNDWRTGADPHECPLSDTELAGTLGISDFVAMAAGSADLDESVNLTSKGVFGGTMQFLVTKSLSALGPTWTLIHFKGPAGLASLSEVNTDKLTLAFAEGPNVGKRLTKLTGRAANPSAHIFLQQLLTGSISSQLTTIQNSLTPH
jgi:hypothetical protein